MHEPLNMLEIQFVVTDLRRSHVIVRRVEVLIQRILYLVSTWAWVVPLVALRHLACLETIVGHRNGELRFVGNYGRGNRC